MSLTVCRPRPSAYVSSIDSVPIFTIRYRPSMISPSRPCTVALAVAQHRPLHAIGPLRTPMNFNGIGGGGGGPAARPAAAGRPSRRRRRRRWSAAVAAPPSAETETGYAVSLGRSRVGGQRVELHGRHRRRLGALAAGARRALAPAARRGRRRSAGHIARSPGRAPATTPHSHQSAAVDHRALPAHRKYVEIPAPATAARSLSAPSASTTLSITTNSGPVSIS